jgi:hypothetical protein
VVGREARCGSRQAVEQYVVIEIVGLGVGVNRPFLFRRYTKGLGVGRNEGVGGAKVGIGLVLSKKTARNESTGEATTEAFSGGWGI